MMREEEQVLANSFVRIIIPFFLARGGHQLISLESEGGRIAVDSDEG